MAETYISTCQRHGETEYYKANKRCVICHRAKATKASPYKETAKYIGVTQLFWKALHPNK